MNIGNLTKEEEALIRNHRAEVARQVEARGFRTKALETACAFDKWSASTGEGLTFSTFVGSFGYHDTNSKQMYDAVDRILDAARLK